MFPLDLHSGCERTLLDFKNNYVDYESLFELLALARRIEPAASILVPALFGVCSGDAVEDVLEGAKRRLSLADLGSLLVGRENIILSMGKPIQRHEWDWSPMGCCPWMKIEHAWMTAMENWKAKYGFSGATTDLLLDGARIFGNIGNTERACTLCHSELIKVYDQRRKGLWKMLPSLFGLCKEGDEDSWRITALEESRID